MVIRGSCGTTRQDMPVSIYVKKVRITHDSVTTLIRGMCELERWAIEGDFLQLCSPLLDLCQRAVLAYGLFGCGAGKYLSGEVSGVSLAFSGTKGRFLPVPPRQELIHLLLLIHVLKQRKHSSVKPLRISHCICPREYRRRTESKAYLGGQVHIRKSERRVRYRPG
jgi:hypothetical protein